MEGIACRLDSPGLAAFTDAITDVKGKGEPYAITGSLPLVREMQAAGFEYVAASDINANPRDIPGVDDVVWRLPPTLAGSKDDEARAAAMRAIGESNRMTLKFVKPTI